MKAVYITPQTKRRVALRRQLRREYRCVEFKIGRANAVEYIDDGYCIDRAEEKGHWMIFEVEQIL